MGAALIPLASAGIGAVGSLIGGAAANAANRRMAREQMAFQERMSSTAYQRATEDMRMSGINPMLAYMQGGASSPGGASAQFQDIVSPAVSSAQHGARLAAEMKLLKLQSLGAIQDNAAKYIENQGTVGLRQDLIKAQTAATLQDAGLKGAEYWREMADLQGARNRASIEGTRFGKAMNYIERLRDAVLGGSATGLFLAPSFGGGASSAKGRR